MRALETGRYLLRSTNTGISAIINPQGQITAQAPQFEVYNLRATAQPYQGSTPYVQWGAKWILGLVFSLLLIGFFLYYQMDKHKIEVKN
jgi:apolipoprotein N-acyltransferase